MDLIYIILLFSIIFNFILLFLSIDYAHGQNEQWEKWKQERHEKVYYKLLLKAQRIAYDNLVKNVWMSTAYQKSLEQLELNEEYKNYIRNAEIYKVEENGS